MVEFSDEINLSVTLEAVSIHPVNEPDVVIITDTNLEVFEQSGKTISANFISSKTGPFQN